MNAKPTLNISNEVNEYIPVRAYTRKTYPSLPQNNSKRPVLNIPNIQNNSFHYPINPLGLGKNSRQRNEKQLANEHFISQGESFPLTYPFQNKGFRIRMNTGTTRSNNRMNVNTSSSSNNRMNVNNNNAVRRAQNNIRLNFRAPPPQTYDLTNIAKTMLQLGQTVRPQVLVNNKSLKGVKRPVRHPNFRGLHGMQPSTNNTFGFRVTKTKKRKHRRRN